MGKKILCAMCGKELGVMSIKVPLKDSTICTNCASTLPYPQLKLSSYTLSELKEAEIQEKERITSLKENGSIPEYVVLQVVLKEAFIGVGSANLSELEDIINRQAAKGYRLHTISTTSSGSKGAGGGDRIQATMVFEKLQ